MTCKDCIYYEVCADFRRNICETDQKRFEEYRLNSDGLCVNFKDKSRYIELPCKVWDTVYSIAEGITQTFVGEVYEITQRKNGIFFRFSRKGYYSGAAMSDGIGKTVFFTREEAEKALAERSRR